MAGFKDSGIDYFDDSNPVRDEESIDLLRLFISEMTAIPKEELTAEFITDLYQHGGFEDWPDDIAATAARYFDSTQIV